MSEFRTNGFIFPIADKVIRGISKISLVEFFKFIAEKLASSPDQVRHYKNVAIDLFITLKWLFLFAAFVLDWSDWGTTSLIVYLLVMNLHTYFFNHVWEWNNKFTAPLSFERQRRRFVSLMLAVGYSLFTYAFLYFRPLHADFVWPSGISEWATAITFSFGNALTGYTGDLRPITGVAYLTSISQLTMTFLFVSIVLAQSMPQAAKNDEK